MRRKRVFESNRLGPSGVVGRMSRKGALCIQDPVPVPSPTILLAVSGNERTIRSHEDADSIVRSQKIQRQPLSAASKAPNKGPTLGAVFVLWRMSCS